MEKLKGFAITLKYILFIGLTIFGFWHVIKKHSDRLNICMWIFPVATYHGLEFFWHNDFAGVNWKERNQRDMKMVSYFFLRFKSDSAKYQLLKEVDEFSKDIKNYPIEQLEYLKNGGKEYIIYNEHSYTDLKQYCKNYFQGDTSEFVYSQLTNKSLLKLKNVYYSEEDTPVKDVNEMLHFRLRQSNESSMGGEEFLQMVKNFHDNNIYAFKSAYKDIFKENY